MRSSPILILALLLLALATATAQSTSPPATSTPEKAPSIQDNSFLVEEAYNQEFGVVQHISSFTRMWRSKDWAYSFTQEWPGVNPKNQFSYTVQAVSPGTAPAAGVGFGDLLLNYRYQLVGNGESKVALAPRLSLIAPVGDSLKFW